MGRRIGIGAAVLIAVFLAGFIPQFVKARRLEGELGQARRVLTGAQLRDLAALTYIQANQKNYGLAAETAGRYFSQASTVEDPEMRKGLDAPLALRDRVSAQLAKGDPAVMADLERIVLATREATR